MDSTHKRPLMGTFDVFIVVAEHVAGDLRPCGLSDLCKTVEPVT